MVNWDFNEDLEKRQVKNYFVLVIYDITDNKKRTKAFKLMSAYGEWVQRSSFECFLRSNQIEEMKDRLVDLLDMSVDMLRIYKMSHDPRIWTYGRVGEIEDEDVVIL